MIVAIIPCYNEEKTIGSVVLKAKVLVNSVIVINDGSLDDSAEVARLAGAKVIDNSYNLGKASAVKIGFEEVIKLKADALILLDGDGQHNPNDIPALLGPLWRNTADIVVGSRFLGVESDIPKYRLAGQKILTKLTNMGSKLSLSDSQSGFRAFSKKAIEVLKFKEQGFSLESEIQFQAKEHGLRVVEVPISISYPGNIKIHPILHGVKVLNAIISLTSKRIPLIVFGIPGTAILLAGVINGLHVVDSYKTDGEFYIGPALLAVLLCVVGTLSIFTGFILHAIKSYFGRD